MNRNRSSFWLWFCCLSLTAATSGMSSGAAPSTSTATRYRDASAMAARIDHHLEAAWKAAKAVPAAPASDAELVRRVYLDLAGRIPTVAEVRDFLADRRADRRERLVESLLSGPRYVTHFTRVWRSLLLPEAGSNFQVRFQVQGFDRWLRDWLLSDKGYDAMVRDLLTAPVDGRRAYAIPGTDTGNPSAFYNAKEYKAEEIAAAASKLFLGVNLGCAQCHNHPFASWKREQFWSFAAFFSGIRFNRQGDFVSAEAEVPDRHEIAIPGTQKKVQAKYLDGTSPNIEKGAKARDTLASWMTAKENPYFARATVNRMWAHFFGTGLLEPLDEMAGGDHRASHPELLDELARGFAEHDYDLKWLIRAITSSRAYQLSSARSHPSQEEPALFARAALRGLTADQLYDSVAQATGIREAAGGPNRFVFGGGGGAKEEFLTRFANAADRPTESQRSILQALTLMNGGLITTATDLKASATLAAVADAPFMTTQARVETLFLATLSRQPTPKELARMTAHVDKTGDDKQRGEALADVFWALLNSSEFVLNH